MSLPRFARLKAHSLVMCLVTCCTVFPAVAQQAALPSSINVIVPFPAGGSADNFARLVAETMAKQTNTQFIVEAKPGAAGIIGTRTAISAPPDGTTLLSTSIVSALVAPKLVANPPFDALKDLTPITPLAEIPALLVVNPSLGIKTFDEFVAYAKKHANALNVGNSGTGTLAHLAAELLRRELNIEVIHVPYKGAPPAVADLIGGHVQVMFSDAAFFIEHIKAGSLIPLAVAAKERLQLLPNVPTTAELGHPSLVAGNVFSLYGPPGMRAETAEVLSKAVLKALAEPSVKQAFAARAASTAGMSRSDFAQLMKESADRWIPIAESISKAPASK